jgi:hypothetical protein
MTLYATFTELSTIQNRAQLKTKAERQKAEIEYALKQRKKDNLNEIETIL